MLVFLMNVASPILSPYVCRSAADLCDQRHRSVRLVVPPVATRGHGPRGGRRRQVGRVATCPARLQVTHQSGVVDVVHLTGAELERCDVIITRQRDAGNGKRDG